MILKDLIKSENFKCISGESDLDCQITDGYTSDLLSDVMANMEEDSILITIQAHKNTIAVAGLKGAPAVLFCNNRPVTQDVIEAAEKEGIVLLLTDDSQFMASVKIGLALELFKN